MNNLEKDFLDYIQENSIPITIYLVNGVKLDGKIHEFDNLSILLNRDGHSQLVYKNAISTIMPHEVINLPDPENEPEWKPVETKPGWW